MKTDPNPQPLTEGQKKILDAIPRARDLQILARVKRPHSWTPRDREADRARLSDPDFNRWLDDPVTENGEFTVWDMLLNVDDAWAGWGARPTYAPDVRKCGRCGAAGPYIGSMHDDHHCEPASAPPGECAANGASGHSFGPHGPKGEVQCEWCGDPSTQDYASTVAPPIDYAVLHAFADAHRVPYNDLCAAVRQAIAPTPAY